MPAAIDAATLKAWLHDGQEIALFDVREAGEFGEGHLLYGVPLPYSRFEIDLPHLAPRPSVRLVIHDGGDDQIAARAAARAEELGYGNVHVLTGGVRAWTGAGYTIFQGINVVSKAFGELAEHIFETPSLSAEELQQLLRQRSDVVVLDGRPFDEYRKMSIPGAICCPNGELAYRVAEIVPDPTTTIVINCAGRTRSIIGAQTLRHAGLPNPVYALRNGTMGWRLAGLDLEHGKSGRYPDAVSPDHRKDAARKADAIAARWGIRRVTAAEARAWLSDPERTTYLLDVRTDEEYAAGHAAGAEHAPGGQLIQATDQWLGTRQARVLLLDDAVIRGTMTALWLQLMGWEVAVLDGGAACWAGLGNPVRVRVSPSRVLPELPLAGPDRLRDAILLDLRPSTIYRAGHIARARWATRARMSNAIGSAPAGTPIVLVASDPQVARAFASDLPGELLRLASLLQGDVDDWRAAGLEILSTPDEPSDAESIDYLFFVHDRHAGNLAAARQYLEWETGLVARMDALERAAFRLNDVRSANR